MLATERLEVGDLISRSHRLLDARRWDEVVDDLFVDPATGLEPWADFGFARWEGAEALRAGFASSMAHFEAAAHLVSNLCLDVVDDGEAGGALRTIEAQYYVQGWHWFSSTGPGPRNADYLLVGTTIDRVVETARGWRLASRTLHRVGPDVAIGRLEPWLDGLGG